MPVWIKSEMHPAFIFNNIQNEVLQRKISATQSRQSWIIPASFHHSQKRSLLGNWDCFKSWSIRFHFCSHTLPFSINYYNPGYYYCSGTCLCSRKTVTPATSCHNELQGPITPSLKEYFLLSSLSLLLCSCTVYSLVLVQCNSNFKMKRSSSVL